MGTRIIPPAMKPTASRGNVAAEWRAAEGSYIRDLREARGLTQADLADAVGIQSKQLISHIETGRVHMPVDWMFDFSETLKIDLKEFAQTLLRYQNPWMFAALFGTDPALRAELKRASTRGAVRFDKVSRTERAGNRH